MRRPAPTVTLSPQVIRQFALVTIIVTGLLAMFSSGENAEVVEAIKAREAQNQLARQEAARLGARKVGTVFKKEERKQSGEGYERLNDPDSMRSTSGGSPTWSYGSPEYRPAFMRNDPQPFVSGPPPGAPKGVIVRRKKPVILNEGNVAKLKEAARARSGTEQSDGAD